MSSVVAFAGVYHMSTVLLALGPRVISSTRMGTTILVGDADPFGASTGVAEVGSDGAGC